MKITLITNKEYNELLRIQKENPVLTFQNNGYEYIKCSLLGDKEKKEIEKIETILSKAITGFSKFNNFKLSKDGDIRIRFQYQWDVSFTGVGYLDVVELLNGFHKETLA